MKCCCREKPKTLERLRVRQKWAQIAENLEAIRKAEESDRVWRQKQARAMRIGGDQYLAKSRWMEP